MSRCQLSTLPTDVITQLALKEVRAQAISDPATDGYWSLAPRSASAGVYRGRNDEHPTRPPARLRVPDRKNDGTSDVVLSSANFLQKSPVHTVTVPAEGTFAVAQGQYKLQYRAVSRSSASIRPGS